MIRIICFITGFVFGSIPTGYLVSAMYGKDIRKMGSGNTGSTNALRTLGKKAGAITFIGDILKAIIPLCITAHFFGGDESIRYLVTMWTGLGAVLGHDFSPWLQFKGGKGIATSGALALFIDPLYFCALLGSLIVVVALTGYVSAGSLAAAVAFLLFQIFWMVTGSTFGWSFYPQTYDPKYSLEIAVIFTFIALLAIVRHKANIQRLLNGTENRLFKKKK